MMKKIALVILLAGMQTHAYAQSVPTKAQVNAEILNTINANGRNGITGPILQADLVQMLAVSASWQGTWGSSVFYSYGEIVSYSGSLWFANTPTLGTPPGSVAGQWTQFSVAAGVITPGTTLIVGGTPGDIEYNNNGVLGEKGTTGSGSVVLSTSPSLTTPDLGTPSAANLANATNLPIATGVSGLGSNVVSALANPLNGSGGVLGTSLASADLFIGNGSGIAAGVPMSGDATISNTGALTLATSGVTAGTYGDGTHSTQVTFDAKGRATSASSVTITHASGDLAAANNLSDLANAITARTNLGLGTFATQNYATPPAIGAVTPNSGAFTSITLNDTLAASLASPAWGTNYGVYNGASFNLNNFPLSSIYTGGNTGSTPAVAALASAIDVPSNDTSTFQADGIAGYATNEAGNPAVGLFGAAIQKSGGYIAKNWGMNTIATNSPYLSSPTMTGFDFNVLYGGELDVNVMKKADGSVPSGTVRGLSIFSGSEIKPVGGAYGIEIGPYEQDGVGTQGWNAALVIDGGQNTAGIEIGAATNHASGTTVGSQSLVFDSYSSGALHQATIQADPSGNMVLTPAVNAIIALEDSSGGILAETTSAYGFDFNSSVASSGDIRLRNNFGIYARNSANTADNSILKYDSQNNLEIGVSGTLNAMIAETVPITDNSLSLGSSSNRWSNVFAAVGTFGTLSASDLSAAGIVTNTNTGVLGTESAITTAQGGLGGNNSSASGIPIFASGVVTIKAANASGGAALVNGTPTVGNCLKWSASGIQDAGTAACPAGGFTVATLPAGTIGEKAYVTDATSCTFLGALTGGGSTFCPVVYNGSAWVGG